MRTSLGKRTDFLQEQKSKQKDPDITSGSFYGRKVVLLYLMT